jgi:hypothetical protein
MPKRNTNGPYRFNFDTTKTQAKPIIGARWRQVHKALMLRVLPDLKTSLGHLPLVTLFPYDLCSSLFGVEGYRHSTSRWAEANMDARWDQYGGITQPSPIQDLLGISMESQFEL